MSNYDREVLSWSGFKAMLAGKHDPTYQNIETATLIAIWYDEGFTRYYCPITKESPANADQVDWDANYKAKSNRQATVGRHPFAENTVEFKGDSIINAACPVNQATNLDLQIAATRLLNGGILFSSNASQGDWIQAQIVDKDELIPVDYRVIYPAWPVLNEWIPKWGIIPGFTLDLETAQAGEIPPGFYIRIIYHADSTGGNRNVTVNFRLNKKL